MVVALAMDLLWGYAGILSLGHGLFFALGGYTMGWFGSTFFAKANVHLLVTGPVATLPGIHVNFLVLIVIAMIISAVAGVLIGLPTLRLRGDYIAIVTLGFGEIIYVFAVNGDQLHVFGNPLTAGAQGIAPVDPVKVPLVAQFTQLDLRPWFYLALAMVLVTLFVNFRLRDSRLGRAWIALREDEVAAGSMGIPLVKTKLMAYATGAAFGGAGGLFHAALVGTVNPNDFQFSFSIFVLAMVILGGLGSIWGVTVGALLLGFLNYYIIQKLKLPGFLHAQVQVADLQIGIFGFLLVILMILRPEGLLPERRRKLEFTESIGVEEGTASMEAPP